MAFWDVPSYPGSDTQQSKEEGWLRTQLGMGNEFSRYNAQSPFGTTTWQGNTRIQQYDPRIMQDYYGLLGTRAQQRDVYGNALNQIAQQGQFDYQGNPLQYGVDRSGYLGLPSSEGAFDRYGQRVEDTLYNKFRSRADEQYAQAQQQQETSLRNKGFTAGSEGYDTQMKALNQAKNDAYTQAANAAILAGGQESSRRMADLLRIRGQQEGEGEFDVRTGNAAQQQAFNQALTRYLTPYQTMSYLKPDMQAMLPQLDTGQGQLQQPRAPTVQSMLDRQYAGQQNQRTGDLGMVEGLYNMVSKMPLDQVPGWLRQALGMSTGGPGGPNSGSIGNYTNLAPDPNGGPLLDENGNPVDIESGNYGPGAVDEYGNPIFDDGSQYALNDQPYWLTGAVD